MSHKPCTTFHGSGALVGRNMKFVALFAASLAQLLPAHASETPITVSASPAPTTQQPAKFVEAFEKNGLAIDGYDPIAYVSDNKAVKGDAKFWHTFRGTTYRFSTAANKDKFISDPEAHEPAYRGWCAFAMADGNKVKIDPKSFKVIGGKVHLFYASIFASTLDAWNKSEPDLKVRADRSWQKLVDTAAKP